jgi:hypothetical protein
MRWEVESAFSVERRPLRNATPMQVGVNIGSPDCARSASTNFSKNKEQTMKDWSREQFEAWLKEPRDFNLRELYKWEVLDDPIFGKPINRDEETETNEK